MDLHSMISLSCQPLYGQEVSVQIVMSSAPEMLLPKGESNEKKKQNQPVIQLVWKIKECLLALTFYKTDEKSLT